MSSTWQAYIEETETRIADRNTNPNPTSERAHRALDDSVLMFHPGRRVHPFLFKQTIPIIRRYLNSRTLEDDLVKQ